MGANDKIFTKIVDVEYFDAEQSLTGDNINLRPKCSGTLNIIGDIQINGEVPGTAGGAIVRDENGNVNLGSNQNEIDGTNNVVAGQHQTIDATNSFSVGNGHTMDGAVQSAIIGGQNNTNNKVGSVILGGYNITAYRDNTAYVPDFKIEGSQIFGVDPISRKMYGEFNRVFDDGTSMVVPHAATHGPGEAYAGYIKLVYCGTPDSEGSITSAKFNDISLTCDGTWKETIIPSQEGGMQIVIAGAGTFSYTAEINESAITTD